MSETGVKGRGGAVPLLNQTAGCRVNVSSEDDQEMPQFAVRCNRERRSLVDARAMPSTSRGTGGFGGRLVSAKTRVVEREWWGGGAADM